MPTPDELSRTQRAAREIADNCLATRARRLDRDLMRAFNQALKPYGITSPQLTLLVGIALLEPVISTVLGEQIGIEKSTLSRNLRLLIDANWVHSDGATANQLGTLSLTPEGATLIAEAHKGWTQAQQHAIAVLGDHADALIRMPGPGS